MKTIKITFLLLSSSIILSCIQKGEPEMFYDHLSNSFEVTSFSSMERGKIEYRIRHIQSGATIILNATEMYTVGDTLILDYPR